MVIVVLALFGCQRRDEADSDAPIAAYDPIPLVDPMIGTGGLGFGVGSVNPGALRPFGMIKVGPDTRGAAGSFEATHCAGYYAEDNKIAAITLVHSYGMGVGDYGVFALMPVDGFVANSTTDPGRAAVFDKATEQASPGYYAAHLVDEDVLIELTATERAAMQRYTFAAGADPVVVLDLGHTIASNEVGAGTADWNGIALRVFSNVRGSYSERFGGLAGWMHAEFDPAPIAVGGWTDPAAPIEGLAAVEGVRSGMWLQFPAGTTVVTARAGLSWVDAEGAAANLAAEIPVGTDFDALRAESEDVWREELATVRVRGGTDTDRVVFHTALYHTMQMPTLFSDVDGRYRGIDQEVHTADFPYYTDFSLWDTFRTEHPWLIVAKPERQADMNKSLVRMAEDWGAFDRWPLAHGPTGGMVGTPTDQVLAESWLKGVRDFDADTAFDLSYTHATGPAPPEGRSGIEGYVSRGYVAWEDSGSPAALTLEYAWSDHALAEWAKSMGRTAEEPVLRAQSGSWERTWDPASGFFVGRYADGTFGTIDPMAWAPDYVEGDAWQYVWMVPYDVPGLIRVQHGGDQAAFFARLDEFWANTYAAPDTAFPDPYYWHGNEPDIHAAYLASLAGDPARSAAPIRWIKDNRYAAAPAGYDGNDDAGTLSAWYTWSAIGVFPIAGTDVYAVGSPWFDRAEIDRPDGTTLTIRAPGASETAMIVEGASIGGSPIGGTFTHAQWTDAAEVVLPMRER